MENKEKEITKIPVASLHIENDVVNNSPRIIMTDNNGEEWVLSHQTVCHEGGGMAVIEKKKDCWYFKPKIKST
jgi:hypothetical protein